MMPMFEGKNDYGKNMWESTITIKRKHFLNMVKNCCDIIMIFSLNLNND